MKQNHETLKKDVFDSNNTEMNGHKTNRIQVSCALIVEQGKLLACRRNAASEHALEWEFPGGKIEQGETEEACLLREIKEELAVEVCIVHPLQPVDFDYPSKKIRLIPFLCRLETGQLKAQEHDRLLWFSPDEFALLNWSAADRLLLETNLQKIIQWV